MNNILKVIPIGTSVIIGDDIQATITSIWIRGNGFVQYDCSWWDKRSYNSKWFNSSEISIPGSKKLESIGFIYEEKNDN